MKQENALPKGIILNFQYHILSILGRGGTAITYKAYDSKREQYVAIKELFPMVCCGRNPGEREIFVYSLNAKPIFQDYVDRFRSEGRLLMSLTSGSSNLPRIYDCFEENNTIYIVMDLFQGCDLGNYWKQKGRKLSEEETCSIAGEMLNVLEYIHEKGIIHRDICLQNILITDPGTIKLIDFGSAIWRDGKDNGSVILHNHFAPPEQYRSQGYFGPWTDLYALGAVMYALVSGEIPPSAK